EALDAAQAVASGFGLTLRLGMTQLTAHQAVVPVLRRFRAAHPQARIKLSEGTTWSLERDVEQGNIDAAFLHPPLHAPGLAQRVLARSNVVLANLSAQESAPLISYPRSEAPVMMGRVEGALTPERTNPQSTGTDPIGASEGNTAIACLSLSAAGYGTALVTEDLPDFGFDIAKVRTKDALFELETSIAWRKLDRRPIIKSLIASCNAIHGD
ncbi:MAG: LysR family substrate-binding domain-containing protein, partial [Pseudomonadota bacterium]